MEVEVEEEQKEDDEKRFSGNTVPRYRSTAFVPRYLLVMYRTTRALGPPSPVATQHHHNPIQKQRQRNHTLEY